MVDIDPTGSIRGNLVGTDKKKNVWSWDFIISKINLGQWAGVWAGLWDKRGLDWLWAAFEVSFFNLLCPKN